MTCLKKFIINLFFQCPLKKLQFEKVILPVILQSRITGSGSVNIKVLRLSLNKNKLEFKMIKIACVIFTTVEEISLNKWFNKFCIEPNTDKTKLNNP